MDFIFIFSSKSILSRKGSQDLPASEYYAIYRQSKKNSVSSNQQGEEAEVISKENSNQDQADNFEEQENKVIEMDVSVKSGGIAER